MLLCRLAIQISKSDSLSAFSAAEKRRGLLLALALSVKKFFSLFFEAPLAAHHHSRHLKENSAAQPLSSDSLNFLTFLFSKELSNFRPGGLCSPSKAGRLLVASPFPVNSFFQHRVFFRQHDCPPLASLDCGKGGAGKQRSARPTTRLRAENGQNIRQGAFEVVVHHKIVVASLATLDLLSGRQKPAFDSLV